MAIKDLVPKLGRGRERLPARRGESDPFQDLQREMNRLFEDFLGDFPLALRGEGRGGLAAGGFSPRVDVSETDREVRVTAELPGMDEKDITVEMDDATVTLTGERKHEHEEKGRNWYHREQSYGTFHRAIALPADVDSAKAKARFRKGVLTLTAPKRDGEKARRKSVPIEVE